MGKRVWWPVAAVCAVVLSVGCDVKVGDNGLSIDVGSGKASDEWTRTYQLEPGGHLEIVNLNGSIEASASSGNRVDVHAMRQARARDDESARDLLRKTEMREDVSAGRVRIEADIDPRGAGGFRGPQLSVRYELRIPPGLNVLLRTQNGEVRIENLQGRITASSTNGNITARRVSGSLDASTVNGGVRAELLSVTDESKLATVNGGVTLSLAPDVKADLEANVVNGAAVVQDGVRFAADERSRQRVAGRINGGGPRIVVQVTNGGVRVGTREAARTPNGEG